MPIIEDMTKNTKKIESWKDLEVWQLAHELVLRVYRITPSPFPEGRGRG